MEGEKFIFSCDVDKLFGSKFGIASFVAIFIEIVWMLYHRGLDEHEDGSYGHILATRIEMIFQLQGWTLPFIFLKTHSNILHLKVLC